MSGTVSITLSNPLTNRYAPALGLTPGKGGPDDVLAGVNETVEVVPSAAMSLISAGYATVDPEDKAAVRKALGLDADAPVAAPVGPPPNVEGPFDPAEHTVAEVEKHLAGADDTERERVLAAERAGKARSSLLD